MPLKAHCWACRKVVALILYNDGLYRYEFHTSGRGKKGRECAGSHEVLRT